MRKNHHTLRNAGDRADKAIGEARRNAEQKLSEALGEHPEARRYVSKIAARTHSAALERAIKRAERKRRTRHALIAASAVAGTAAAALLIISARKNV